MTKDFGNDVLPTDNGGFFPATTSTVHQMDTWRTIWGKIVGLLHECVRENELPGWALETRNIVIGFWMKGSVMDNKYGARHSFTLPTQPGASDQ